jgi:hypothetical protein
MLPRSLSDLRLIYCGKADIGQIFRSFSSNSDGYSPQTIEKFDSIPLSLVTIAQVRQAPCGSGFAAAATLQIPKKVYGRHATASIAAPGGPMKFSFSGPLRGHTSFQNGEDDRM